MTFYSDRVGNTSVLVKRLAWKTISEVTYFVSSGMQNLNQLAVPDVNFLPDSRLLAYLLMVTHSLWMEQ